MGFTATWVVYDPAEVPEDGDLFAETPQDVDRLVTLLSDPNAGAAMVVHAHRPPVVSEFSGNVVPDHLLWALVHGGFGYLVHHDADHTPCALVGDPTSAPHHYDYTDFEAGTGVPLALFARALKEFLATAERPTCVEWRETD